ncbi:MAG: ABC transporter substrate-binding protein [Aliidongia sp.]
MKITTVRHVLADDEVAALRRYEAGELDYVTVPAKELERIQATYPSQLHVSPFQATGFLAVNLQQEELQDARIRRALSMVLDRDTLFTRVLKGTQIPAIDLIPGGIPGYTPSLPDWAGLSMPDRVAAARKLMAEARGADAPPLKLVIRFTKSEQAERILVAIASMWKTALGVEAKVDFIRMGRVGPGSAPGKLTAGASLAGLRDYADPWTYLANFRSDARTLMSSAIAIRTTTPCSTSRVERLMPGVASS